MKKLFVTVAFLGVFLTACANPAAFFSAAAPTPAPVATTLPAPTVAAPTATLPPVTIAKADWQKCDAAITEETSFQCAVVQVPLDYAKPDGEKIGIHIIRLPRADTALADNHGPLLVNPGGPGASGIEWFTRSSGGAQDLHDVLGLTGFDIIGFDPRGVGLSGGLYCQSDADIDKYRYPDTTPDDDAEKAFLEEAKASFAKACIATYGDSLSAYSTTNTARDMDSIRQALQADQISFIGYSYGTYLGGVYSHLFPDKVRAMVLDGAYQPEGDSLEERYTTQLIGFEKAMDNWVIWCQDAANACAFAAPDVSARWDALWQQFDDKPVTAEDGRVANQATIEDATRNALYGQSWWPELGRALAEAEKGDTERLWYIVDTYDERDEEGRYSASESAFPVIICASGILYDAVPDAEGMLAKMREISPRFTRDLSAADLAAPDDCTTMITPPPVSPISNASGAPVIVIGGLNDPATPMRWAEKMTADMGPTAQLVTYSGEGHTALMEATCVDDVAYALLVDLEQPSGTVACAPDPDVSQPSWWASLPAAPSGAKTFGPDVANDLLGIERRNGYVSGYALNGDTATNADALDARFVAAGFRADEPFEDFYSGQRAVYVNGDARVDVTVLGSDAIATDDWSYLAEEVEKGQGMVWFIAFAE